MKLCIDRAECSKLKQLILGEFAMVNPAFMRDAYICVAGGKVQEELAMTTIG